MTVGRLDGHLFVEDPLTSTKTPPVGEVLGHSIMAGGNHCDQAHVHPADDKDVPLPPELHLSMGQISGIPDNFLEGSQSFVSAEECHCSRLPGHTPPGPGLPNCSNCP